MYKILFFLWGDPFTLQMIVDITEERHDVAIMRPTIWAQGLQHFFCRKPTRDDLVRLACVKNLCQQKRNGASSLSIGIATAMVVLLFWFPKTAVFFTPAPSAQETNDDMSHPS